MKDLFEEFMEQKEELEWGNKFCQTKLRERNLGRAALEAEWRTKHAELQ